MLYLSLVKLHLIFVDITIEITFLPLKVMNYLLKGRIQTFRHNIHGLTKGTNEIRTQTRTHIEEVSSDCGLAEQATTEPNK